MQAVLFDLGGVLVNDPWQSILLTPHRGLVDRLGLSRHLVSTVAARIYEDFVLRESDEDQYRKRLELELGLDIPSGLVAEVTREVLRANHDARPVLDMLRASGIHIGVVSDTTSFWYPKEARLLELESYADARLLFLSFVFGVDKKQETGGLFECAATVLDPSTTLVVDDRAVNLDRARSVGFHAVKYRMEEEGIHLAEVVKDL